jgi:hypothetical protein
MKKQLRIIDPAKLSPGVRALNPHLVKVIGKDGLPIAAAYVDKPFPKPTAVRKDKPDELKMNRTELNFFRLCGRYKDKRGYGLTVTPWPMTLRWGGAMHYTPDFGVKEILRPRLRLIEVKGAHIRSRDIVRFKGCRAEWNWLFDFEMHQLVNHEWKQIL